MKGDCWEDGDRSLLGQAHSGIQEIWLATSDEGKALPESSITDTFLHETIHAISRTYGLGLDEDQTTGLAGGLLQVIRDNKLDFRESK